MLFWSTALHLTPPPPQHHKHFLMIMCIILSVCEYTLLESLDAIWMTEINEIVSGRQLRQGVKRRIFTP